jgi:hypothetical protein
MGLNQMMKRYKGIYIRRHMYHTALKKHVATIISPSKACITPHCQLSPRNALIRTLDGFINVDTG